MIEDWHGTSLTNDMALGADLSWRRLVRRVRRRRAAFRSFGPTMDSGALVRAEALGELSRVIGADWDGSIQSILKFDAEVLRLDRVSFWSLSGEASSLYCEAGYLARRLAFEHGTTLFETQAPEYFAVLGEARTLDVRDVRTDPRCCGLREYCADRHISSLLDVPVWVDGRLSGVLCHEHVGAPRRWSAKEEAFAVSMGQFVSSALAARAHTAVEAGARRAAFLDTLSLRLTSLDVHEVQRTAVALSVPMVGEMALLWMLRPDGLLDCVALKHVDPSKEGGLLETLRAVASDREHLTSVAVRQSLSVLVPEATPSTLEQNKGTPAEAIVARFGMRSGISVPLVVSGKPFGAMTFLASERRYGSEDLALAESVVARIASTLENARLYELAHEAIRARDDLLALTAHELRTPLTALQLKAQSLQRRTQRGADSGDAAQIDDIALQVQRFGAIVSHVLEALSIRAEGVELVLGPCDLATMVADRVRRATERAKRIGSPITVDSPSSLVGNWDRARLETVIDVLVGNAIKFGLGTPIAVTLRADQARIELSVRDGGIGIPADRLSSIFQPFERAVPKEHFGGLRLGLYIVRAIVDAHRGSIDVTSQPGQGSTFVVRLPLALER